MNLRGGPSILHSRLGIVSYGDAVVVTETAINTDGGTWVKVKPGGLDGWLNRKFLKATQPALTQVQQVLGQQIDEGTVHNVIFTCRACYDPDDKSENDSFPIVTTYSEPIIPFLTKNGYIRRNRNGDEFFTAKAKRSSYFEVFVDGDAFAGAGFRFAHFKNPKITVGKITSFKDVPVEYDFVPTDLTKEFFGEVKRIKSYASFSYEDGGWAVCIACGSQ